MAIITDFLEEHDDGVIFYRKYSDIPGKALLQVETGVVYGEVAVTNDDIYTYTEVDDPEYADEDEDIDFETLSRELEDLL